MYLNCMHTMHTAQTSYIFQRLCTFNMYEKPIYIKNKVIIQAYSVTPAVERCINSVLKKILKKNKCLELITPIYTCMKELIINAVKANFKNIYFEDYSPKNDSDKIIDYEIALKLFKLEMSHKNARYLKKLAKDNGYSAKITLETKNNILYVSVVNPVSMTKTEQKNVKQKLKDAMKYNDITQYFLQVEKDPNREGAGLGLVLISIMLKSLGVGKKLVIKSEKKKTIASFSIPLTSKTVELFYSHQ